jgi:two-component system NtrC family sensor kinase
MRRVSDYPRLPPSVQLGLRLQIVLALAGLMLLAFVPLFFAVASLTRATVVDAREHAARALGRAIAVQVTDAQRRGGPGAIERALGEIVESGDVDAACVFAVDGSRLACVGSAIDEHAMRSLASSRPGPTTVVRGGRGRALGIVTQSGELTVVTRLRLDDTADRGTPLVRLVALYMVTFGLALLVFAYFVLTRLIVRPVEQLVEAADRVANGARTLRVPRSGARELIELGASVQAMAERLIREEAALILKVDELTQTTTRLTDTQAQLVRSERMASVGRLAAGVAHEIGNPIAALMGMQDLLLDGQLPPETQEDFLVRMRRETERIHAVVRDLLDFARPEENLSPDARASGAADVDAVVNDVVDLVRTQKPFRDVRIETDIEESLRVALPAPRLTQVLLNVVLNAGAAVASMQRPDGRVVIRARRIGVQARIEVEDTGPGVAPEVRDRLFEPFATTKSVGEGTGLGLAVCRGLVESAGGEIGVDLSYREGARFYIVLAVPA